MIKWAGFGKLLKLLFFGLLISCFTLLGGSFASAGTVQLVGFDSFPSIYSSGFNITFLKGGGLLSTYLGQSKSVLAFNNSSFFWRDSTGQPYFYDTDDIQGYFGQYWSCSELTGLDSVPTNCVSTAIEGDYQDLFKGFFSQVKVGDYAYYDFVERYYNSSLNGSSQGNVVQVCWSSHSIGQSICFRRVYSYNSNNPGQGSNIGTLVNSQGFTGLNFSNLPNNRISYAPGQAGYNGGGNIEGDSTNVSQSTLTGNLMSSTCDKYKALAWYRRNGYSEKLCYSSYGNNDDIFSGAGTVTAFALTGTDIKSVWSVTSEYRRAGNVGGSMGYSERLKYWRNTYEVYQRNSETYENPFLGVPVSIFTLMGNLDIYGKPYQNDSIVDYCNLLLYSSDLSTPYSGLYSSQICSQSLLDMIGDFVGVHAESGQVVQGSSRDGITNRSGMHNPPVGNGGSSNTSNTGTNSSDLSGIYQDGLTFENDFFNKLSSSFRFPNESNSNGIIPSYIIIFLIGIVFFRFLSH